MAPTTIVMNAMPKVIQTQSTGPVARTARGPSVQPATAAAPIVTSASPSAGNPIPMNPAPVTSAHASATMHPTAAPIA